MDWDKWQEVQDSFGKGWGVRVICQSCGTRQRVRLQRGCKVSKTACVKCGKATLKKARIDDNGNVLNDPSITIK